MHINPEIDTYLQSLLIWKSLEVKRLSDIHITIKRILVHGYFVFLNWVNKIEPIFGI